MLSWRYVRAGAAKRRQVRRSEQVAWQPDDHHRAEDGEADAEPQEAPLPAFRSAIGVFGEWHAAIAALGFLWWVVLLAIQASGHGGAPVGRYSLTRRENRGL